MAVGFTPKHREEVSLDELTQAHFLVLSNEAINKLGWKVSYISSGGIIAYTDNGMFSRNSEIKIKIEHGTATLNSASTGSELMDWGKNKKNISEFSVAFQELKSKLTHEEIEAKHQELQATFPTSEEDLLKLPPATTTEQIESFFSIFKPVEGYFISPIFVNLNIAIFMLMVFSGVDIMVPDNESLLNWGANFRPMTLDGEWWRLLTNFFLHIGIFHLLMNMYALVYIGVLLEPILGRVRFFYAYMLTGITASLTSLWWHELTISAGASGAIFGMYGVFLALLSTSFIEKNARKALLTSISIFVGYNLLSGMKGGIDNAAHIGGLLGGVMIGYALIPSLKKPKDANLKYATIGIPATCILIASYLVLNAIPNDVGDYYNKMKDFASNESKALEYYSLPESTSTEKRLYELKDHGINYWQENIKMIDNLKVLELPLDIMSRNILLKKYCELRMHSYEFLYKSIYENTDRYNEQIDGYNKEIELTLKELEGGTTE